MRKFMNRLAVSMTVLFLFAAPASALTIDVIITGILDSTFTPKGTVDPGGATATATLVAGDVITIDVSVANPAAETVATVAGTMIIDGSQLLFGTFLGTSISEILIDQPAGFPPPTPTSLARIAQPAVKINTPNLDGAAGDVWVQAMAFAGLGTKGVGPDGAGGASGATSSLFFEVQAGAAGNTQLTFDISLTPGDVIDGSVVTINSATINVPEPGSLALGLASLGTIGLVGGIRRRR